MVKEEPPHGDGGWNFAAATLRPHSPCSSSYPWVQLSPPHWPGVMGEGVLLPNMAAPHFGHKPFPKSLRALRWGGRNKHREKRGLRLAGLFCLTSSHFRQYLWPASRCQRLIPQKHHQAPGQNFPEQSTPPDQGQRCTGFPAPACLLDSSGLY